MSLITAMLMLGIITMTHELGHSLSAKLNGIGVIESFLGMGPGLFSFEKGGTRYSFKILPFGGSCVMLEEDEGITNESTFNNKSVWVKISVVAAGLAFNFILAFGLSTVLIGITGYDTTRLAGAMDGYPTQIAGMEADDVTKSTNGRKVHSHRDINWYLLTHPQKSLTVAQERTKEEGGMGHFSMESTSVFSTENNQYMVGVQPNPVPNIAENVGQPLVYSAYKIQYQIHYVFDTFHMVFHGMMPVNDTSGPAGIVNVIDTTVDEAASHGMSVVVLMLINSTIPLSASLDVVSLPPILVLDSRRLMFLITEAVRGKPIDRGKEGMVHMARMMVLLALMVLILFNDARKLF